VFFSENDAVLKPTVKKITVYIIDHKINATTDQ